MIDYFYEYWTMQMEGEFANYDATHSSEEIMIKNRIITERIQDRLVASILDCVVNHYDMTRFEGIEMPTL